MNESERLPIDSDLLQTFVRIAECGNLTVAAGKLGRTQSAISVQLRKLENGLGATLFIRTPKGMMLTPNGEQLLFRAKDILADIRETAKLFSEPLTGSIHVGLPDDFDETILERVLMTFSRAHPGVQVLATSGCTSGYAAAIRAGELDVAVSSGPNNEEGETLGEEETIWACRKDAILHVQDSLPLAILDRGCWWQDLPIKSLSAVGRKHQIAFRSASFASLQAALRAGFAIGILPKSCMDKDLRVLTEAEGFPRLPASRRCILVSAQAPSPIASAMTAAIRNAHDTP